MINKEAFFASHNSFPVSSLEKITEVSLIEFPKKMRTLKIHLETQNRGETLYFAINIMESFAFIYKSEELEDFCKKIAEDVKDNNLDGLKEAYHKIDALIIRFSKELKDLMEDIKQK